jgi:molybdopterin synthase catalytic subunit
MGVAIVHARFEPLDKLKSFEEANADSGAIATFIGRCRPHSQGAAVVSLELQHYPGFTEREIARFLEQTASSSGLRDALIIHRVGSIGPGEAIVLVAAASDHRSAALQAVATLIDYLKTDAPFWKREITSAGEQWIEPSPSDYQRRGKSANS